MWVTSVLVVLLAMGADSELSAAMARTPMLLQYCSDEPRSFTSISCLVHDRYSRPLGASVVVDGVVTEMHDSEGDLYLKVNYRSLYSIPANFALSITSPDMFLCHFGV